MTVRELIQELIECDMDAEVVIDFTTKDTEIELDDDKSHGDIVNVPGEEKSGTDIEIVTYRHESYRKVHIEVEED